MGLFAHNIGTKTAEDDVEIAIANLVLWQDMPVELKKSGAGCYLLTMAGNILKDAELKVLDGKAVREDQ